MVWKPVPGFDFVEASDDGRIRTVDHETLIVRNGYKHYRHTKGRELVQMGSDSGHMRVNIYDSGYIGSKQFGVHVLVCKAWYGEAPSGKPWALHRDGNLANNDQSNLYWGSPQDNANDRVNHGNAPSREKHGMTSLTESEVAEIKKRYMPRTKRAGALALAKEFGVHRTTIENIVKGRTWQ